MRSKVFSILLLVYAPVLFADESVLSFDQAIQAIIDRNTDLSISQAEVERVRARNLTAKTAFLPSFEMSATTGYTGLQLAGPHQRFLGAGAKASLNLFKFGADYEGLRAAWAIEDFQLETYESVRLEAEKEAVVSLAGLISQEQEVAILTRMSAMQAEAHRIAEERYRKGLLPRQDVEKVSLDLENSRSQLAEANVALVEVSARVENRLGHTRVVRGWPWKQLLVEKGASFVQQEAVNLDQTPRFRQSQHKLESEERGLKRTYRLLLPSLDASAGYGYSGIGGTATLNPGWSGALTLSAPLFSRLSDYSAIRTQAQSKAIAEQSLEQSRRDVLSEWDASRKAFRISLDSALSREKVVESARALYQDNLKRFQMGRIGANELIVDQTRLFNSELFAVQGWSSVHRALARVCHAQGKRISSCF